MVISGGIKKGRLLAILSAQNLMQELLTCNTRQI